MRRIAVFAVFALLAAGCTSGGNDPGRTFSPTSTYTPPSYSTTPGSPTTPPSSPSIATTGPNVRPGEKPPVLPAVGKTKTPAGARAFAVFYIEALDWGYATMDSTLAKSLYAKSCAGCARFVTSEFDQQAKAHRHYGGARLRVTGVVSTTNDHRHDAAAVVDVTVSQSEGKLVDGNGRQVRLVPSLMDDVSRIWLKWLSNRWLVTDWKGVVRK